MNKRQVLSAMSAGRLAFDDGAPARAVRWFDRAVALDPACAQAYFYRAGLRLLSGDLDAAAADFRSMEGLDHGRLMDYKDFSSVSARTHPRLPDMTARMLTRTPDLPWGLLFYAHLLQHAKRVEEALPLVRRALALAPRSAVYRALTSQLKPQGRSADVVADMEEAVRLEPDWGWLRCWLGEARRRAGQLERAAADLTRGLALDPSYLRAYSWRGAAHRALGRRREALSDLTRSLRRDPLYAVDFAFASDQTSWAYHQRALCRRENGELPLALADMDAAHRLAPRFEWTYNPKREDAPYRDAVAELGRFLRRSPRHAAALAWRGRALEEWGRKDEARADLALAMKLRPRCGAYRAWNGRLALSDGKTDEALCLLNRAIELDPHYSPAYGERGRALKRLGRTRAAEADFARARRYDPSAG